VTDRFGLREETHPVRGRERGDGFLGFLGDLFFEDSFVDAHVLPHAEEIPEDQAGLDGRYRASVPTNIR
jgi:hypothetical protein